MSNMQSQQSEKIEGDGDTVLEWPVVPMALEE